MSICTERRRYAASLDPFPRREIKTLERPRTGLDPARLFGPWTTIASSTRSLSTAPDWAGVQRLLDLS
jgi:hypothetical protein